MLRVGAKCEVISVPPLNMYRRHKLVFADPGNVPPTVGEIASAWFAAGRPGIVRRPCVSDAGDICLGIPLPPAEGKLRISCEVAESAILEVTEPPTLAACLARAPVLHRESLNALHDRLNGAGISANVVGSLAWETITGLAYLTNNSDVDLLFMVNGRSEFERLDRVLADWYSPTAGKYDLEIMLPNGNGFLWKEYRQSRTKMLVKGNSTVFLASLEQLFA